MTTLGIGVRVYIKWAPLKYVANAAAVRALCSVGRIVEGPGEPGALCFFVPGEGNKLNCNRMWGVRPDHMPGTVWAAEDLLVPIEDWGEKAEPRAAEVKA